MIICEAVKYILKQQCNCVESIPALSLHCLFMILFEGKDRLLCVSCSESELNVICLLFFLPPSTNDKEDYVAGRKWAMRAQKIMETAHHIAPVRE